MSVDSLHLQRDGGVAGRGLIGDDEPTLDIEPPSLRGDEPTHDLPAGAAGAGMAMPAALPVLPPHGEDPFIAGSTLCGRYLIEGRIGGGGSAVVLHARDLGDGAAGSGVARHVAIKVLRPALRDSAAATERFQREFHRLRQLSHPGIVRVFELDRHAGVGFQVMELLEGDSLASLMNRPGAHPTESQSLALLADCAEALAWAHARGFIHGDIKPGNIFVKRDGRACLLDFGAREEGHEPQGLARRPVHATPAYASPQVLEGLTPEPRDDVFSLACVAFELLSGRHPFDRMNAARARAAGASVPEVPSLTHDRTAALAAGLSFVREGRPGDVRELIGRIAQSGEAAVLEPAQAVSAQAGIETRGPDRVTPSRMTRRRFALEAMLVALVMAGAWLALRPSGSPERLAPPSAVATPQGSQVQAMPAPATAETTRSAPPAATTGDAATGTRIDAPAPARTTPSASAARPQQQLSFASGSLVVSRKATYAAIPVRRTGGATGRVALSWRIVPGSAQPGRDYDGPATGVVVFADSQVASTLFVPLIGDGTAPDDRSFAVVIDKLRGGANRGEVTRVDVTLRPTGAEPVATPR